MAAAFRMDVELRAATARPGDEFPTYSPSEAVRAQKGLV